VKNDEKIEFLGSSTMVQKYREGLMLEVCSVNWLEPHKRSQSQYKEFGLDPEKPQQILTDIELLKKISDSEADNPLGFINRTVEEYFNGDIEKFQKRWKEFYDNWWPKEFQTMKQCIDEIKAWLKSLLDPEIK
jgi:hypothetical protein